MKLTQDYILSLGFTYDDYVGKYFLDLEFENSTCMIDLRHSNNGGYWFTRTEMGATIRFFTREQLDEYVAIVKRSLRKE